MYIERLTLRDVKGFELAELDFKHVDGGFAGWNVLAGRNGSGKSTILRAIAMALRGPEHASKMQVDFGGWVRAGRKQASIEATMRADADLDHLQSGRSRRIYEIGLELAEYSRSVRSGLAGHQRSRSGLTGHQGSVSGGLPLDTLSATRIKALGSAPVLESAARGPWLNVPGSGWFMAGYGPFRRLGGESRDAHKFMSENSGIGSVVTLFREDASLADATRWARDLPVDSFLGLDMRAILGDQLLPPDGIEFDSIDESGEWFRQGQIRLRLEGLSDGFRSAFLLVLDLFRQLQFAYSIDTLDVDRKSLIVSCPGIVLIDEVETHLHPGWQQVLGPWLVKHFPNLQFIVTTHSPFVCQAASPGGLFELEPPSSKHPIRKLGGEEHWKVVNGSADDALLSELFGLERSYSAHSEQLREEVSELGVKELHGKLSKKQAARLRKLEAELPSGPGPELERLMRVRQKRG